MACPPIPPPKIQNTYIQKSTYPLLLLLCCCYLKVFFGGGQSINTRAACEKETASAECRWRKGISNWSAKRLRERVGSERGACAYDSNAGFERSIFRVLNKCSDQLTKYLP